VLLRRPDLPVLELPRLRLRERHHHGHHHAVHLLLLLQERRLQRHEHRGHLLLPLRLRRWGRRASHLPGVLEREALELQELLRVRHLAVHLPRELRRLGHRDRRLPARRHRRHHDHLGRPPPLQGRDRSHESA